MKSVLLTITSLLICINANSIAINMSISMSSSEHDYQYNEDDDAFVGTRAVSKDYSIGASIKHEGTTVEFVNITEDTYVHENPEAARIISLTKDEMIMAIDVGNGRLINLKTKIKRSYFGFGNTITVKGKELEKKYVKVFTEEIRKLIPIPDSEAVNVCVKADIDDSICKLSDDEKTLSCKDKRTEIQLILTDEQCPSESSRANYI